MRTLVRRNLWDKKLDLLLSFFEGARCLSISVVYANIRQKAKVLWIVMQRGNGPVQ